jgi:nucleoside-diphosphate-sugar epimerase
MRVLVTGGSGVLGRAAVPLLRAAGHDVVAPPSAELDLAELDLLGPPAVAAAVDGAEAVLHLATRIPGPARLGDAAAWAENDGLRREGSRLLVDGALAGSVQIYVQPTVTFVYPAQADADEDTPLAEVPVLLRSALAAEAEAARFAAAGRRGVVLRLGLLDGPGARSATPDGRYGATLHVEDAGRALVAALAAPSGIYNVTRDGERVSNGRFRRATGWEPER